MDTIDVNQLKQWQAANRPFLLVNVLGKEAFDRDSIPGSKHVPVEQDDFAQQVGRLAGTKDRTIVVYCASKECDASPKAARKLEQAGFSNVYDFEGGMKEWNEAQASQPAGSSSRRR
jgi:rhodanese-related sulfurtransferase